MVQYGVQCTCISRPAPLATPLCNSFIHFLHRDIQRISIIDHNIEQPARLLERGGVGTTNRMLWQGKKGSRANAIRFYGPTVDAIHA
jgi:hypothetical protein